MVAGLGQFLVSLLIPSLSLPPQDCRVRGVSQDKLKSDLLQGVANASLPAVGLVHFVQNAPHPMYLSHRPRLPWRAIQQWAGAAIP